MTKDRIILGIIIFVALILAISLIGAHRFHGDEALYASWSMDMAKSTSIFINTAYSLQKPPFYFLLAALFYAIMPVKETFAIIPNILAFLFSIYVIYLILLNYYKNKHIALTGAFIFSLTPINLLFSATSFTDPLSIFFALFSTYYLIKKRYFLFALFFGFAFGTKQFALFYIPFYFLIILIDIIKEKREVTVVKIKDFILKVLFGFFSSYSIAVIWGMLNSVKHKKHILFSLKNCLWDWPNAYAFYLSDVLSRMGQWLHYYKQIYFSEIIYIPILIIILLNLIIYRKIQDFVIAGTTIILFLLVSISHMPIFDRYILTFTPFVIMLSASSLCNIFKIDTDKKFLIFFIITLILFLALPVRKGVYKYGIKNLLGETIGAMYTRNDGIDLLANYLRGKYETPVSICMHRDFSWIFDYYLYRAPAGYAWFHYQPNDNDREEKIKSFANDLKNTKRKIFLLFYADNDEIEKFKPFLDKYNLKTYLDYEVYDRFNKLNIVLYRVILK